MNSCPSWGGGEVILKKSKRRAVFPQENVPKQWTLSVILLLIPVAPPGLMLALVVCHDHRHWHCHCHHHWVCQHCHCHRLWVCQHHFLFTWCLSWTHTDAAHKQKQGDLNCPVDRTHRQRTCLRTWKSFFRWHEDNMRTMCRRQYGSKMGWLWPESRVGGGSIKALKLVFVAH